MSETISVRFDMCGEPPSPEQIEAALAETERKLAESLKPRRPVPPGTCDWSYADEDDEELTEPVDSAPTKSPALRRLARGLKRILMFCGAIAVLIGAVGIWTEALERWEGATFAVTTTFWVLLGAWGLGKEE